MPVRDPELVVDGAVDVARFADGAGPARSWSTRPTAWSRSASARPIGAARSRPGSRPTSRCRSSTAAPSRSRRSGGARSCCSRGPPGEAAATTCRSGSVCSEELGPQGLDIVGVAFDDTVAVALEWVDAADPRPTFPMLLDREHLLSELYGIFNVPTVIWIDEDDRIARAPVIAPGDDSSRTSPTSTPSVHHDQLRAVGAHGGAPAGERSRGGDAPDRRRAARAPRATRRRVPRARGSRRRGRAALPARRRARTDGLDDPARQPAAARRRPVRPGVLRVHGGVGRGRIARLRIGRPRRPDAPA